MATKPVLRPSIVRYTVGTGPGDDITPARYQALVERVGDWFAQSRTATKEPVLLAKRTLDACLAGVKPKDGTPWEGAATVSLAGRVKIACRFDMEAMRPLQTGSEKTRQKREAEKVARGKKREAKKVDQNYPAEYREGAPAGALAYGDDPALFFTEAERADRTRMREGYLKQFPQLDNIAAEPKLDQLLDLVLLQKRLRFRTAKHFQDPKNNPATTERQMAEMTGQVIDLEKAMGIDPVTLAKTQRDGEGGSIGDAVRAWRDEPDYRKVREALLAEELILAYEMYHQASPRDDMDGYQLDEVGLFGLTRCREVTCPHCGKTNFAGFDVEEIKEWLTRKGYRRELTPEEVAAEDAERARLAAELEAERAEDAEIAAELDAELDAEGGPEGGAEGGAC